MDKRDKPNLTDESLESINQPQQQATEVQQKSTSPKNFSCPSCGGSIKINALGHSVTALCNFCSSVIDITDPNFRIIERDYVASEKILIEIGTRGKIDEIEWEVIGYTRKTDGTGEYSWEEYLLYNPYQGFRFLVQSNGHWSFVKVLRQDILGAGDETRLSLDNRTYKVFIKGEAVVNYVKGEFYWRVRKGERTQVTDYISPPYMLSVENNDQEINYSLGQYIEPKEISKAFKLDQLPRKVGVGAIQPNPRGTNLGSTWLIALVAISLTILIHLIILGTAANENIYSTKKTLNPNQALRAISSAVFHLPKSRNIQLKTFSSISNSWAEYDFTLINNDTNETYYAEIASEYYFGVDSDGRWQEGSQIASTIIPQLPAGNYRLVYEVTSEALQKNKPFYFELVITRDVPVHLTFIFAIILILLPPIFRSSYYLIFESERWAEADFSSADYMIFKKLNDLPRGIPEKGAI